ncbi:MAG TPA: hypothetical protein VIK13_10150 [Candidatus Limnocylindrales bacterium]
MTIAPNDFVQLHLSIAPSLRTNVAAGDEALDHPWVERSGCT